ncbi:helix-turn-helix domain-containing protein [Klebsiella michiganensis]|uniref:transcriptional regulator n=1 Tax=Klebsiella michiganensis TaxID=1134687 RepID=UPI001CCCDA5B|nr:YdaS family helix-turn-helix protein [Klebsiella michiganensis]EMB9091250.1 helix-turn-helix domain-containing protein [Klebsiella michiganensis]MBZ7449430.1 helix-turn-helix domain-containing protein [Klebsiella michiganensis]
MKKETKDLVARRFTQAEIGQRLNVSQQTVFKWLKKQVPSGRVIPLCQLMGWEVTPHELRPDLHPTPISGIPEGVILPKKQEGV